ncbi:CheY-like chemotaxis protein [Pseudomonas citronellolis]|nr:CheY-like chemotaxis protein [Pseudomonas citronellolis]MCP1653928.1 CheY-like chemotaxis protein [Pseudomonas citronellolis]MCP1721175.1 CheY-like chemotaxis protein [Pseudomonas citronellolis]
MFPSSPTSSQDSQRRWTIRALLVDDDEPIRELLCGYLARFNIEARGVADGAGMRQALAEENFDVVVLDLMLPGEDGLSLCRYLRSESDIPILMLTARCEPADRIIGLELGADDYMAKPFEPRELVARIQTILRRVRGDEARNEPRAQVRFDQWRLDTCCASCTPRMAWWCRCPTPSSACSGCSSNARAGCSTASCCWTPRAAAPSRPSTAASTCWSRACARSSATTRARRG